MENGTMLRHVIRVADLTDAEIDLVLQGADEIVTGNDHGRRAEFVAATVFLTSSLRTRVGFSTAAARLGGSVVNISEVRVDTAMSEGEGFADTLRTVSGMVDVVITRTPFLLDRGVIEQARCPVINGGDGDGEHPTQALIDISAIEAFAGPVGDLRLGVCGDLTMRAVTSLLHLLGRRAPRELRLMSPGSRLHRSELIGPDLDPVTTWTDQPNFEGLDVLYLPGLPRVRGDDVIEAKERSRYAFSLAAADALPQQAVVLSPLPVIDEVDPEVRRDRRVRMFDQSDRGVAVRMALMELLLGR